MPGSLPVSRLLLACFLMEGAPAAAQTGVSTVVVSATLPDGSPASGARIELIRTDDASSTTVLDLDASTTARALTLPAGRYQLRLALSGFQVADTILDARASTTLRVSVYPVPAGGAGGGRVVVEERASSVQQIWFDEKDLEWLPGSRTIWSLVEIAHPFVIVDRIDNGGLWSAVPGLVGGYGSSTVQTGVSFGPFDITDPSRPGTPLLYPSLNMLQGLTVDALARSADSDGPGPVITLTPRRAGLRWEGSADVFVTPTGLQADVDGGVPAAARFDGWTDGSGLVAGPLTRRIGVLATARMTRAQRIERDEPFALTNNVTSVYAHLFGTPAAGHELRLVAAGHQTLSPYVGRARYANRDIDERGRGLVVTGAWHHVQPGGSWSANGGYQRLTMDPDVGPDADGGVIERLRDGPPLSLTEEASAASHRWDVRTAVAPGLRRRFGGSHAMRAGVSFGGARVSHRAVSEPPFAELIDGRPARVWDVRWAGPESRRTTLGLAAFFQDQVQINPALTLNVGLRLDHDRGSSAGAVSDIAWTNVSPRVSTRWQLSGDDRLLLTFGYGHYQHRLPIGYLAVADPAAPTGVMYRWDDRDGDLQHTAGELTPVAAVGTCCAAGVANTIDPHLRRPWTAESVLGLEHRIGGWRWRVAGIYRREHQQVGLANTGVTLDDYSVTHITDPGVDIAGASGYNDLPIYNRIPESFLRDRYVLTNADGPDGTYQSGEITVDRFLAQRWQLRFGGLVQWARVIGASRGFRVSENDQGLLGETFTSPNAQTNSRGRPFFDRAYIVKTSLAYQAPGDVRLTLAARYQDGQPFARVVVADGLNQGPEIIQAYRRGGQRFTYTMTVDARIEKRVRLGRSSIGGVLELFNLLNQRLEVEEHIVTGPRFREVTAVQPPRAARLGLRLAF